MWSFCVFFIFPGNSRSCLWKIVPAPDGEWYLSVQKNAEERLPKIQLSSFSSVEMHHCLQAKSHDLHIAF